jgi:hypothetical protein
MGWAAEAEVSGGVGFMTHPWSWTSESGFDEAVAALPLELETGPHGVDFRAGHGGVFALGEVGGFEAG